MANGPFPDWGKTEEPHSIGLCPVRDPLVGVSDLFGRKGKQLLTQKLKELPGETQWCVKQELTLLEQIQTQIKELEHRLKELVQENQPMQLIQTALGIGDLLTKVIIMELGNIERFNRAEKVAAYSGLVPRVHSIGRKDLLWKETSGCEPVFEMGFCGSGQRHCPSPQKVA